MRSASQFALLLVLLAGCSTHDRRPETTIAAAANLKAVFQSIGPDFEARTGIHPVFSFASTAQLAQQIENAAPFDVFAAADSGHVEDLERKGVLTSASVYATGILALWIPPRSAASITRLEDLASPEVKVIAVAKPELAPYGQAAMQTLEHTGLLDKVKGKIVYAENIDMAKQYGASRNADAVFTAYSLVLHAGGNILKIDEKLHQPITQELGIVARSEHQDAARKFADYILKGPGHAALLDAGYR